VTSRPTIGVVIPAHDAGSTLASTLASVAAQEDGPDEVVVVDDASSDDTAAVARSAGVAVLASPAPGAAAARNHGIASMDTDYVAFLDADDAWEPGYCATARALLGRTPVDLLVAQRVDVGADGVRVERRVAAGGLSAAGLLRHNPIATSGVVVSRRVLQHAGGFDEEARYCEDLDLWVRLLAGGARVAESPAEVRYTVRDVRESADRVRDVEAHRLRTLDRLGRLLRLDDGTLQALRQATMLDVGRRYLKSGWRLDAARCFWAARTRPAAWAHLALVPLPLQAQRWMRGRARRRARTAA